jgi:hypothetical protein
MESFVFTKEVDKRIILSDEKTAQNFLSQVEKILGQKDI